LSFPQTIRNKKTKAEATIYGKSKDYPFYRVCWRVAGKRRMKSLRTAFVIIHVLVHVPTSLRVRQHSCHLSLLRPHGTITR